MTKKQTRSQLARSLRKRFPKLSIAEIARRCKLTPQAAAHALAASHPRGRPPGTP